MTYMDIPYALDPQRAWPECRFMLIWKVQANDAYHAVQEQGFRNPGLFVTFEGQGRLSREGKREQLHAGTYRFVERMVPCTYQCVGGDWKFYYIEFSGLEMARELGLTIDRTVTTARMAEAVKLCKQMVDCLIMQPVGYAYTTQSALHELILLFAHELAAAQGVRHPELDEIVYQMHMGIGRPFLIDDLIRQSGLSRTGFFSRFREMTGMSPSRYMQELKLASAKASLETTRLTVKEIASSLHFYDEFHFSKMFKQRYGMSPSAYRRKKL